MAKIDMIMGDLRKLQAARATFDSGYIADIGMLTDLKGQLGDALLDGANSSKVGAEIYACQVRIDGAAAVRPKLLAKIRAALVDLGRERAGVVRGKAKALADDLARHEANITKLKMALETAAGCRYEQAFYALLPAGHIYTEYNIPREGPSIAQCKQAEIDGLLAEAARIEKTAAQTSQGGRKEGATVDELLTVADDMEAIAPTRVQIAAWASTALARADEEWGRTLLDYTGAQEVQPIRVICLDLNWDGDGQITPASRVHNKIQRGAATKAA